MGTRGPVPKREAARRRRNKQETETTEVVVPGPGATRPAPDPAWHPVARRIYDSLPQSAQTQFYQPSDWAVAYYACELVDRSLQYRTVDKEGNEVAIPGKVNGQLVATVMSALSDLLATEGARRRVRMEITNEGEGPELASVTAIGSYAADLV